ncbi:MAG: PAS domain S-box protein [Deltaproteobacteria bacterium]|nr:PAS domain S-box protein [Deltaproteobacteria bacterium]
MSTTRHSFSRTVLLPLGVFLGVALIFFVTWLLAEKNKAEAIRHQTELMTEQAAIRLEEFFKIRLNLVGQMRDYWLLGRINTPETFTQHALAIESQFAGIQAINWVDRYGVIQWVVPETTNRAARGLSLATHPTAGPTFRASAKTGEPRMTMPLDLVQGGRGITGYFPIMDEGHVRGFINVVFRIGPMIEDALARGIRNNYDFAIYDEDGHNSLVYSSNADPRTILDAQPSSRRHMQFANHQWLVVLTPTEKVLNNIVAPIDLSILILGFAMALVLSLQTRAMMASNERIRASERQYRAIFEAAGTAMINFDEDSVITLANSEFLRLAGITDEDVARGVTWRQFITPESMDYMDDYHEKRGRKPESVPNRYEAEVVDSSGKQHVGIVNISVVPGTSKRVASFLDLTDQKRAEAQMFRAEKLAALGQISAGIAHEINNPNNFIYFNLPILKRYISAIQPFLDAEAERNPDLKVLNMPYAEFIADLDKLIGNMKHGSERINGIVSELKNYIRSHDAEQKSPKPLNEVIDNVLTLAGKQVGTSVRHLDVDVEPDLPLVRMNSGKIEQVLINLLVNAAQASDKEDSRVSLRVWNSTDRPGFVAIEVEDNGHGIPPDILGQIFDPFFTTKGRESGTGLGLAISQRIIEEHGGEIRVASTPGVGTRFTVMLPNVSANVSESDSA